jgi:superfamily II DNA/RNA helicase
MGVPQTITRALARRGIEHPSEIQAATIADTLAGRDIRGRAPTGSGKTLAFGIPLVASVDRASAMHPRGLVLAPTRELADQIANELNTLSGSVRVGVVYGGVGYGRQNKELRRGVDILVACPGRLEDLIERGALSLTQVNKVVIDEADRMSDMGFLPAVRRILDQTSSTRQTVLFSATLDHEVAGLSRRYQTDPVTHEVGPATPDIESAEHRFLAVDQSDRIDTSADLINEAGQAIVFCRTRHGADRLARQLTKRGVPALAIHGGHAQNRRNRALERFATNDVRALVATDVAARGIHVDDVAAVLHYDPPADHKAYIHRSGRTARAGRAGLVVSLVQPDQVGDAERLQRQLGRHEVQIVTSASGAGTAEAVPAEATKRSRSTSREPAIERSARRRRGRRSQKSRRGPGTQQRQAPSRGRSGLQGS